MGTSKEVIDHISNGKYAEAKTAMKEIVTDNIRGRITTAQTEMGLVAKKAE